MMDSMHFAREITCLTLAMEFLVFAEHIVAGHILVGHIGCVRSNPKTELNCNSELKAQLSTSQSLF